MSKIGRWFLYRSMLHTYESLGYFHFYKEICFLPSFLDHMAFWSATFFWHRWGHRTYSNILLIYHQINNHHRDGWMTVDIQPQCLVEIKGWEGNGQWGASSVPNEQPHSVILSDGYYGGVLSDFSREMPVCMWNILIKC